MAGYIEFSKGRRGWGTSSSLFNWVLLRLADHATNPLAEELRVIVEHNVGMVGIDEFTDEQATEFFELVEAIPDIARGEFTDWESLPGIVEQLEELVRMSVEARAVRAARGQ